jgi:outer membrane protein assembly factor BamE (lipoprotein component of BamABCDE complex)
MSTTKRLNRRAVMSTLSFALAIGAAAMATASPVHAEAMPKFSIHVDSPRVTSDTIARVAPGMSQADIESLVGTPARTEHYTLSQTTAWDYNFRDAWGYQSVFSVIFDDAGSVVGKVSTRNNY